MKARLWKPLMKPFLPELQEQSHHKAAGAPEERGPAHLHQSTYSVYVDGLKTAMTKVQLKRASTQAPRKRPVARKMKKTENA